MRRIVYLSAFVALSGIAGMLYYSHTQQSTAVVATRDLPVGTRIQDADLAVRRINPASVGPQVLTTVGAALGQVVAFPVLAGQMLVGYAFAVVALSLLQKDVLALLAFH